MEMLIIPTNLSCSTLQDTKIITECVYLFIRDNTHMYTKKLPLGLQ